MVQAIKTGDQAISFFAKHGTNMPIKFLNCNRKQVAASMFRPYDLVIIEDEKALDKEYFTISAQGVVQVFNEKRKRKGANAATPTEFLSLSDWMQQSTMFNVLTSMKFFKHYLIGKIFGLWKGNVRYRTYQKTRQQLAKSLIQARPDF
jgi:dynein heavy chain